MQLSSRLKIRFAYIATDTRLVSRWGSDMCNKSRGRKQDNATMQQLKRREQMRNKLSEKLEELALQKEYELWLHVFTF